MSTSHDDLQRSLGRVEGNQSAMEARMDRFEKLVTEGFEKVEKTLSEMQRELGEIKAKESERKGAWKIIATIAATVSALVVAALKHFIG